MKKVIIPVLILSSIVLGGCIKKGEDGKLSLGSNEPKGEPFQGSMMAAAKLGVPYKCSYKVGEMEAEGYIQGKNYRGKSEGPNGETMEIIMKDNCMWMWSENSDDPGVTFCYEGEEAEAMWSDNELEESEMPEGYEAPDMEFNCNPTIIGPGTFEAPSGKEFNNMTEMMNMFNNSEQTQNMGEDSMMQTQNKFENMDSNVDVEKLMEQYGQ